MLKHATLNRTLQLQRNCQQPIIEEAQLSPPLGDQGEQSNFSDELNGNQKQAEQYHYMMQTPSPLPLSCDSSPTPSLLFTPTKQRSSSASGLLSSSLRLATGSLGRSPTKSLNSGSPAGVSCAAIKCAAESMIKVFAQTLSQDVEYVTLHVNTQTKSNHIVKTLLKKFRLKHRDPNLFYLTLERYIRKDGLKQKNIIILDDEACPLQYQQCCSNPPHNDIKFTLMMRTGALVKIFCSDVVPDAKYKCISLSTQTTVEETIELMLHCLNLVNPAASTVNNISQTHLRLSNSPVGSTGSSASSNNSSSSGIESDPTENQRQHNRIIGTTTTSEPSTRLDSESRASSVTSISSSSNVSNLSSSVIDQYCLVIECKDSNFKRILDSDEYLVDVYHNLLADAKGQPVSPLNTKPTLDAYGSPTSDSSIREQPDQWFFIKLKRRGYDLNSSINRSNRCMTGIQTSNSFSTISKFNTTRQNVPLPPLPLRLAQFGTICNNNNNDNVSNLKPVVTTTAFASNANNLNLTSHRRLPPPPLPPGGINLRPPNIAVRSNSLIGYPDVTSSRPCDQVDTAHVAPKVMLQPPIRPRRRNLSNVSSTFGRPLPNINRRRYDPAQLAEDIHKLDVRDLSTLNGSIDGQANNNN